MRRIVNRKAVLVEADDPPPAKVPEGSNNPGDSLKASELDVGADRQNSEPPVDYTKLGEHVASVVKAAEVAAERIREKANLEAATTLSEADRVRAEAEEVTKMIREGAAADAEAKRREAEAEAAKIIASAKRARRAKRKRRKSVLRPFNNRSSSRTSGSTSWQRACGTSPPSWRLSEKRRSCRSKATRTRPT